jgi:hypothetical protein
MNALVFYRSEILDEIVSFYTERLGFSLRRYESPYAVVQLGDFVLGFFAHEKADTEGQILILLDSKQSVTELHKELSDIALSSPDINTESGLWHFYAGDPEGRIIEFREYVRGSFVQPFTDTFTLYQRRSIRKYSPMPVEKRLLMTVLNSVNIAPTARNLPSVYLIVSENRTIMEKLVEIKGRGGEPLLSAPLIVAVCADGAISKRLSDDSVIATYHLMLSAHINGLGTCYIGGMNDSRGKAVLGIPEEDYIATVTPWATRLSFPKCRPKLP